MRQSMQILVVMAVISCVLLLPIPIQAQQINNIQGFPTAPDDSLFATLYWDKTPSSPKGFKSVNYGFALPNTNSVPIAKVAVTGQLKDGWHGLYVKMTNDALNSNDNLLINASFYGMGYAEGYASAELIYNSWYNQNIGEMIANMSTDASDWVNTHLNYMRQQAYNNPTDTYWQLVAAILLQIEGVADGYNDAQALTLVPKPLDFMNIFMLSFLDEVGDVERSTYILNGKPVPPEVEARLKHVGEHCSAIAKLLPDDVYIAHATWASLGGLLRVYKTYQINDFILQSSSYPGNVASDDDFYLLGNGLVAQETTNHNHNNSNTGGTQPYSVSEFIRVLVASYASNGDPDTWGQTFCKHNSGTYNNQYMILNLQGFQNGAMRAGGFYVAEQMPGLCISQDQTEHLNTVGYWASYNRPFYPQIWEGMNWTAMEKLSSYYSYSDNYRALIFAREQAKVTGLEDMKALMRYNDYKHDEYSIVPNCTECWPQSTPYLSIAARCDLVPANGTFGVLNGEISLQDEAAIDAKIISFNSFKDSMTATIASGPPFGGNSQIPPFSFSSTKVRPKPRGLGLPTVIQYNYTSSNTLFQNAVLPVPDFSKVGNTIVTFSGLVSASNFVRETFAQDLMYYLVDTLNFPDPTGQTTCTLLAARWYASSIMVTFEFSGPSATLFNNYFARTGDQQLAGGGLSSITYTLGSPSVPTNEKSSLWIIGVVIASLMFVFIIVLLANYIRTYKSVDKEESVPFS